MIPGQRVEYRPALKENIWWVALWNAIAAFIAVGTIVWHVWEGQPLETAGIVVFVLWFGVWPWAYLRAAVLWLDETNLGVVDRLFRRREIPRAAIRRVVGVIDGVVFLGPEDRILMKTARFLNNDQLRAIAVELGLKAEGVGRGWNPL